MNYYRSFASQNLATISGQLTTSQEISSWYLLHDWLASNEKAIPEDLKHIAKWLMGLGIYPGRIKKCTDFLNAFMPKFFVKKADGWHDEEIDRQLEAFKTAKQNASLAGKKSASQRIEKILPQDNCQTIVGQMSDFCLTQFEENQTLSSNKNEGMNNTNCVSIILNERELKLADTNNRAILSADCPLPDETLQTVTKGEGAPSQAPQDIMKESTRTKVEGILNNQEINDHRKIVKLVQLCEDAGKPLHEDLTPQLFNNAPEALKLFRISMDTNTPIKTLLEASDAFQPIPDITEEVPPVIGIRTPEKINGEQSINLRNYVEQMRFYIPPPQNSNNDYDAY